MEDEQWMRHLLQATHRALARLREPEIPLNHGLVADLEALRESLEVRIGELGSESERSD